MNIVSHFQTTATGFWKYKHVFGSGTSIYAFCDYCDKTMAEETSKGFLANSDHWSKVSEKEFLEQKAQDTKGLTI